MKSSKEIIKALLNTKIFAITGLIMLVISIVSIMSPTIWDVVWYNKITLYIFYTFFVTMLIINYIAIILKLIKIKNISMLIGVSMFMVSVVYVLYAITHPEADLPFSWSYETTWVIYRTYVAVMIVALVTGVMIELIKFIKNKRRIIKKD